MYVGSAQDASQDQVLDEILVGPVPVGTNKFVLQADAPDPSQLAKEDLLGVTVVLVTCSYKEREFVRVGYYVNNEYVDPNAPPPTIGPDGQPLPPTLPDPIPLDRIQRQILADKPRVTKFPIPWADEDKTASTTAMQEEEEEQQQQQMQDENDMTGQNPLSDLVSMPEESNASFAGAMTGGVEAMAE